MDFAFAARGEKVRSPLQLSPIAQSRFVWLATALAIAAYFPRFQRDRGAAIFSAAADCMLDGQTPRHCGDLIYAYPPFFALLWTPLAPLPTLLRVAVWYVVVVGTIIVSLRLCEVLIRRTFPGAWSERELVAVRVLTFLLGAKLILTVLGNQAFDSVAVVFIFAGLVALLDGRALLGGASLAIAAALKVTPVIFLPYLLFKRRFAAAGAFIVVLVVASVLPDILLPPKQHSHVSIWLRDVVLAPLYLKPGFDLPFWVSDSPMNQSFHAAIVRFFTGVHEQQPFEAILFIVQSKSFTVVLSVVMGLYILIVGCVMLKSRQDDRLIAVDGALLIISALLLSPVTSGSHYVGLLLPYALLSAALIKYASLRIFYSAMLFLSFVLLTATSNDLVGRNFTGWALWNNVLVYGALVLVIPLAVLIWSSGASPGRQLPNSAHPPAN